MKSHHMAFIAVIAKCTSPTRSLTLSNLGRTRIQIKRWCQTGDEQKNNASSRVCIIPPENPVYEKISNEIAAKLDAPYFTNKRENLSNDDLSSFDNYLHVIPYQFHTLETYAIAIQPVKDGNSKSRRNGKKQKNPVMQPFYIDFCPPLNTKLGQRIEKQAQQKGGETLLRAVGLNKMNENGDGAVVYDLNAGFGQDSTLLAMGGARHVFMIERDPIVGLLLTDALRRLQLVSNLEYDEFDNQFNHVISRAKNLHARLSLHVGDSVEFSKDVRRSLTADNKDHDVPRPDVCYLDPMFPPRRKSSAVKKNMQILHGLFHHDESEDITRQMDERRLLEEALLLAKRRVVVKRPINALPLGIQKDVAPDVKIPSYELKGSINRFDVYVLSQPDSQ